MSYEPSKAAVEAARNAYLTRLGCSNSMRAALIAAREVEDAAHEVEAISTVEIEELATFMVNRSFSTGHGDTHADLLNELGCQIDELRAGRKGDIALRVESPDLHAQFQAMARNAPLPWRICMRMDNQIADANGDHVCVSHSMKYSPIIAMILTAVNATMPARSVTGETK